ncbi:hypothetical protein DCO57_08255 [Labrenzia sp. 011]|nr:hypothetical protein DCO57_08255 [Labrenzia sp. 011]
MVAGPVRGVFPIIPLAGTFARSCVSLRHRRQGETGRRAGAGDLPFREYFMTFADNWKKKL